MSLELIEKFLLVLSPPDANKAIHSIFLGLEKDPLPVVVDGFNSLHPDITKEGSPQSVAAVNGMLLGVAISYGIDKSPRLKAIIEDYIIQKGRIKGENVIDFSLARAGRADASHH